MMDLDISELELFEGARKDPYLACLTAHYPHAPEMVPPIEKEFFLAAVGKCRKRMREFLDRCETVYRETVVGRAFDARLGPPATSPSYSIHTRKNDQSIADVQRYALRDGIHYLTLWTGMRSDPLWLAIAKSVAFMTSLDDLIVRPGDITTGAYRVGLESMDDILERIRRLGGNRDVRWLDACREDIVSAGRMQFAEKWAACLDEDARAPEEVNVIDFYTAELNTNTLEASLLRSFDNMSFGGLCLLSYYYNFSYEETDWANFHSSALCDGLGADIGKDAMEIGIKDPTNFGDLPGRDRSSNRWRREEIDKLFCQLTRYFHGAIDSPNTVYDRFARVALSYARLGDRYLERHAMARFAIKGGIVDLVQKLETPPDS